MGRTAAYVGHRPLLELSLAAAALESDPVVPLPESARGALEVELRWAADSSAELLLEQLDLVNAGRAPRPPVVFISVDTLAARHLSLHGYERPTSPRLEELAEEAVVFERYFPEDVPAARKRYHNETRRLYAAVESMELCTAEVMLHYKVGV